MTTVPPWSYTALSTFESCPKQYYHRYILKEKAQETIAMKHGTQTHKYLEDRLRDKKELPNGYSLYEPYAKSIEKAAAEGELHVEIPLAIDRNLIKCDFFGRDVWGRGKADVIVVKGDKAWIGDWKTGRTREKNFQVSVFAAMVFRTFPRVNQIVANNIWLMDNKVGTTYKFEKSQEKSMWQEILAKVNNVEACASRNRFDPKPSGLCGFCDVKTCQFNTVKKEKEDVFEISETCF